MLSKNKINNPEKLCLLWRNCCFMFIGLIIISCSEDDIVEELSSFDTGIAGQTVQLIFSTAQDGAPYTKDQLIAAAFSNTGQLSIDVDPSSNNGSELVMSTFTKISQEYQWEDTGLGHLYTLSLNTDGSVNELNLNASSGQFLGQFTLYEGNNSELGLVQALEGTYQVGGVDSGQHDRMSVIIDASGNIDFDTNISLNASDYELITDRIDVLNSIFIDLSPYPSEPYQRVEIVLNSAGTLAQISYYPEYPAVSGRSIVNF